MKRTGLLFLIALFITAGTVVILKLATAGDLEPSDPPDSTMHTLEEIYNKPVWDMPEHTFVVWAPNPRFAVSDNDTPAGEEDDLVLDRETGLIWARNANVASSTKAWISAMIWCHSNCGLGNRFGWRLPTVEELSSLLVTITNPDSPLPEGHPFINVQEEYYWTSTNYRTPFLDHAWAVRFTTDPFKVTSKDKDTEALHTWPVRGGSGPETRVW